MTVGELIDSLDGVNRDRIIVLSRDSEGNGFSPLSGWETAAYKADTTWSGEVGLEELTEDDIEMGYGPGDVISDGQPCIVFIPIN